MNEKQQKPGVVSIQSESISQLHCSPLVKNVKNADDLDDDVDDMDDLIRNVVNERLDKVLNIREVKLGS